MRRGDWRRKDVKCTCDDFTDTPCLVHQRENALAAQRRVGALWVLDYLDAHWVEEHERPWFAELRRKIERGELGKEESNNATL